MTGQSDVSLDVRFSDQFAITTGPDDDWFDPVLAQDTPLAVDPYLAFRDSNPRWSGVRDKIFDFFGVAHALALATPRHTNLKKDIAVQFLRCREPQEFCLGVSTRSPEGHGTGNLIAEGMLNALKALAMSNPDRPVENMEVLRLFVEGVAFDLISDMVCTILKADLIAYTQDVARRHNIPMEPVDIQQSDWVMPGRWLTETVDLPINQARTDEKGRNIGVLLVPKKWLRKMRRPDTDGFVRWTEYSEEAATLRAALNLDTYFELSRAERTERVRRVVWQHPDLASAWGTHDGEREREPYNVDDDPKRLVRYPENGMKLYYLSSPDALADDPANDFCGWVGELSRQFRDAVEQEGGWEVLWEKRTGQHVIERVTQASANMFFRAHCYHKDVTVSREVDVGRGLVDFHFSRGQKHRALIEVKHMDNAKLVNGAGQLAAYLRSEKIDCGYLLCLGFTAKQLEAGTNKKVKSKRQKVIEACAKARKDGYNIRPIFIDAQRPLSASKL